jgi:drug/metabolite transporter (DMT)-like permease
MLPIIGALALFHEPAPAASTRRGIAIAIAGGVLSCVGNIPYYGLLASGAKAATVVPLTALAPMITVLLAVILLKERLSLVQMLGIGSSLAAIYFFNVPDERGLFSLWLLGALGSIALWGTAGFLQKVSTYYISGTRSALWFLAAFVPVAVVIIALDPLPSGISARVWLLSAALGFTLALGNFAVLAAFASGGKASIIAPLSGLYPLISLPIAILLLDEWLTLREGFGVLFAVAAVAAISFEAPAGADHPPVPPPDPFK